MTREERKVAGRCIYCKALEHHLDHPHPFVGVDRSADAKCTCRHMLMGNSMTTHPVVDNSECSVHGPLAALEPRSNEATTAAFAGGATFFPGPNTPCGLTNAELEVACRNVGVDLTCGACAAIFLTGAGLPHERHTCERRRESPPQDRYSEALLYVAVTARELLEWGWDTPEHLDWTEVRIDLRNLRAALDELDRMANARDTSGGSPK